MKKIRVYLLIFSLGLCAFIVSSGNLVDPISAALSNKSIPFPPASEISDKKGDIRIGIERVIKEHYYITYSKTEGNRSYFGIYLIVENLKKNEIDKEAFKKITVVDNLGNKFEPLPYQEIFDFPEDKPLGWKVIIFNKFAPINDKASFINIKVKFGNNTFKLDKIYLP